MASFTVTNTNNDGAGSLRKALLDAALLEGDDTIVFAESLAGQEIVLASELTAFSNAGRITIDGDVDGDGNADITISGNNNTTNDEFSVRGETPHLANNGETVIRNLTFKDGRGVDGTQNGTQPVFGSVRNDGTLTLENVTFDNIQALGAGRRFNGPFSDDMDAATILNRGTLIIDDVFVVNSQSTGGGAQDIFDVVDGGDAVVGILQQSGSIEFRGTFGFQDTTATAGGPGLFGVGTDGDAITGYKAVGGTVSGLALIGEDEAQGARSDSATGTPGVLAFGGANNQGPTSEGLEFATFANTLGSEADPLRTEVGTALIAFRGDHVIRGQTSADTIHAGDGADTVLGDGGADTIFGGGGNDVLNGDGGIDPIGDGADTIHGEGGDDTITGGFFDDFLFGGDGNDTFLILGVDRTDDTDGGDGVDTVDYSGAAALFGFESDLSTGRQVRVQDNDVRVERGSLTDVENLIGSGSADTLTGDGARNMLMGMGGDDTVEGGDNRDELYGGDGNDTVSGDDGNDTVSGGDNNDVLNGGDGRDVVNGEDGRDTVNGGAGNDTVSGGSGNDVLNGDAGRDRVVGASGNDTGRGGGNNDTMLGGRGKDDFRGNGGNDNITGGDSNDTLRGDSGRDRLDGGSGRDKLTGGTGNDRLDGGSGNDIMTGGSGRDRFEFDRGDDRDTITDFRQGQDTIAFGRGGANKFEDLRITDRGADVLIRYDGGMIRIITDDADNFTARDFDF